MDTQWALRGWVYSAAPVHSCFTQHLLWHRTHLRWKFWWGGGGRTWAPTSLELGLELSRVLLDSNVCFTLIGKVASFLPCFLPVRGAKWQGADFTR